MCVCMHGCVCACVSGLLIARLLNTPTALPPISHLKINYKNIYIQNQSSKAHDIFWAWSKQFIVFFLKVACEIFLEFETVPKFFK
ncbi:hypothetical protein HanRHA438_Chr14g0635591 [Helianthus annuus]|nr:hypothetical protein HanRHA438_Chr14g0635591 [Helianthus annuus]